VTDEGVFISELEMFAPRYDGLLSKEFALPFADAGN